MVSCHGDRLSGRKKRKPGEQKQGWNFWEREGHRGRTHKEGEFQCTGGQGNVYRSHCDERRSHQVPAVKLRTDGLQEGNGGGC